MRPINSSGSASLALTSNLAFHQGNQLNRIQNGINDGSLTTTEATGLAAKQASIAQAEISALSDGKVGWGEFKQLRQMQREASRDIFEQRHNGSSASSGTTGGSTSCGSPASSGTTGGSTGTTGTTGATSGSATCVEGHQGRQSTRIQNGIRDGSLTGSEASQLMAQQNRIAEAKGSAMADGTLDATEFNQIRNLQREASRDIFELRHNGSETAGAADYRTGCIEGHQGRQSTRIQNGLSDGSLTASEASQLMGQQNSIAEAKGGALADGTMDQAEFSQLRSLQREASRDIFFARHNCGIRA